MPRGRSRRGWLGRRREKAQDAPPPESQSEGTGSSTPAWEREGKDSIKPAAAEGGYGPNDPGPTWESKSGGWQRESDGAPKPSEHDRRPFQADDSFQGNDVYRGSGLAAEPATPLDRRTGRLDPGTVSADDDAISAHAKSFLNATDEELEEFERSDPEYGQGPSVDPDMPPPGWHELAAMDDAELAEELGRMEGPD